MCNLLVYIFVVLVFDITLTGKTQILIINNTIYIPDIDVTLILPFIIRIYGLIVNEYPKVIAAHPTEEHHSVFFLIIRIHLHLDLNGIIYYIITR